MNQCGKSRRSKSIGKCQQQKVETVENYDESAYVYQQLTRILKARQRMGDIYDLALGRMQATYNVGGIRYRVILSGTDANAHFYIGPRMERAIVYPYTVKSVNETDLAAYEMAASQI